MTLAVARPRPFSGWCGGRMLVPTMTRFWHRRRCLSVVSSIDDITNEGFNWHLSFSHVTSKGVTSLPSEALVVWGLAQFKMPAPMFEDNHVEGGRVRNFFLQVDPERRAPCECATETVLEDTPIEGGGRFVVHESPDGRFRARYGADGRLLALGSLKADGWTNGV